MCLSCSSWGGMIRGSGGPYCPRLRAARYPRDGRSVRFTRVAGSALPFALERSSGAARTARVALPSCEYGAFLLFHTTPWRAHRCSTCRGRTSRMPFEIKRARHAAGPLAANAAALNRPAWKQITAGLGVNSQIGELARYSRVFRLNACRFLLLRRRHAPVAIKTVPRSQTQYVGGAVLKPHGGGPDRVHDVGLFQRQRDFSRTFWANSKQRNSC